MTHDSTTITLPSGLSAHAVAGPVELAEQLRDGRALEEGGAVLAAAGAALWEAAYAELATLAEDFLRFDLVGTVVDCWCAGERLAAAGATTTENSAVEVVTLVERDLRLAKHPAVDLVLGSRRMATLTFDVALDVHADLLSGTVRRGALVGLTGGPCTVTVSLALGPKVLARGSRTLDAYLRAEVGNGIPLAGIPGQRRASPSPAAPDRPGD